MRRANLIRGRIEQHGDGVGLVSEEMVQARAREVAIANGRRAEDVNESDLEEARNELRAAQNAPPDETDNHDDQFVPREGPPEVSEGRAAKAKLPTDEEVLPEQVVAEGVDEADHEQMVAGNLQSRERDARYDDQLPER